MNVSRKKLMYIVNTEWYFQLHWLTRALHAKKMGFEVHIVVPHRDMNIIQEFESLGFILHHVDMPRSTLNIVNELKVIRSFYKVISQVKPDVIHSITIKPNLYAGHIAKMRGIPIIASIVGLGVIFSSSQWKYRLLRIGVLKGFKWASSNPLFLGLCENHDDLEYLQRTSAIRRCKLIKVPGAGVDIDNFQPQDAPSHGPIKVFFASRLLKDKGVFALINAARWFKQRNVNVEFLFAGILDPESPGAIDVNMIETLHREGIINWLGRRYDIPHLITQSHIVSLPSTYGEGIPRILIEAAACGRPIVTTDVPGCREICRNNINGLTVPPNNQNKLNEAIESLVNSPTMRHKMGAAGRLIVENEYTNEHVLKQLEALYLPYANTAA